MSQPQAKIKLIYLFPHQLHSIPNNDKAKADSLTQSIKKKKERKHHDDIAILTHCNDV